MKQADFTIYVTDGYEILDRKPPLITIRIPFNPLISWKRGRPANPTLAIRDGDEVLGIATIRSAHHHFIERKTDLELLLNI